MVSFNMYLDWLGRVSRNEPILIWQTCACCTSFTFGEAIVEDGGKGKKRCLQEVPSWLSLESSNEPEKWVFGPV